MKTLINLFQGKKTRSFTSNSGQQWFSAVDVCAVIRNVDYQKARNYWKFLKTKIVMRPDSSTTVTMQMKMEAPDGKLRMTDVVDAAGIIKIINACPSPAANLFRQWIEQLAAIGINAAEFIAKTADKVKCRTEQVVYKITITRRDIIVNGKPVDQSAAASLAAPAMTCESLYSSASQYHAASGLNARKLPFRAALAAEVFKVRRVLYSRRKTSSIIPSRFSVGSNLKSCGKVIFFSALSIAAKVDYEGRAVA